MTAEYALRFYDCAVPLAQWLEMIQKAQKEDGELPGIVPTGGWGYGKWHGPQWDKALVELPYLIYRYTGEKESVLETLGAIERWIGYLERQVNGDGLICYGLPDWCEAGGAGDRDCSTPVELTDTLISIEILRKARQLFLLCGDGSQTERIDALLNRLENSYKKKYIDGNGVTVKTQTAQALTLDLGLFEAPKEAFAELVRIIERDGNHMRCGVLGYRPVFRALAEFGRGDLAYGMIISETHPGYGNIVKQGATGLWEKFTEYVETDRGIRQQDGCERNYSLNHSAFGGVASWFMEYLAGIRILSKDTVVIKPCRIETITDVCASFENGEKKVSVRIETVGGLRRPSVKNRGFDCKIADGNVVCHSGLTTTVVLL